MRINTVAVLALVSGMLLLATQARSQAWLGDRKNKEGPGFKLGESLVLHVGIGAEGGFDSNATYAAEPVSAGRLRLTPYVDIATRSAQRMEDKEEGAPKALPQAIFRFGFAAYYDRYFSGDNRAVDNFNSRFNPFSFDTHLNFTLLPQRKVSVLGGIKYIKTLEPYETNADAQSKHSFAPSIGLRIMPGGGTLTIEPKYRLNLLHFSDDAIGKESNRYSHEFMLATNWKIFPQTALISTVLFSPTAYYGEGTSNINSMPLRSWFGIQGLLLETFGFRFLAGYGAGFYASGKNFEGLIGDVAIMLYINHFAKVTLGIKRDFVDSFYGNFYVMNGGYLNYEHLFYGRFLLSVEGSIYKRVYANYDGYVETDNITIQANTTAREDIWISFNLMGELRASDWLSFHSSLKLWKDVTDFASVTTFYSETTGTEQLETKAGFSKVEFFVGARIHY